MLQSIYTHAGCDYGCLYTYSPRHCFNPHTHAGCDNVHNVSGASFPVSIHTPTQGVTAATIFCSEFNKFQSTHPRRVWLIYHFLHFRTECFNPHTHAGCDDVTVYFSVSAKVSIHTPTQGVTLYNLIERAAIAVSIHTPTQGVTPGAPGVPVSPLVSIHTPTQGVTTRLYLNSGTSSFNPHTHAGCDHGQTAQCLEPVRFNPHTHAGCDSKTIERIDNIRRFQSTHPRRVWLDVMDMRFMII